jgi:hypothetical protein
MGNFTRCTRCLLPSSLSYITFDEEGVCNYCRKYEKDFQNWDSIKERKEKEFKDILMKAQSLKRAYDCLVPLSGGKDSTYVLYLCTKVYKLKTLAVSLDNGFLSNPAKGNIKNALANCNADHIYYTINRENSRELFKTFLQRTGDFCNACMRGINYAIEISLKSFNIPLVIRGSGRRVQYVSQIKEVSGLNTASYFGNVLKGTNSENKFKRMYSEKHKLEFQKIISGISDIFKIRRTTLMRFVPQHIGMYDYIYLPFTEIIEIIKREMGWKDNSGTVEHLDCELHDVPFYKDTLRIPNITKNTFHRSGLIRQGIIKRGDALLEEEKELAEMKIPDELLKFLNENGITYDDYAKYVKDADKSKYEPKIQKLARDIYHKFRKF